MSRHSASAVRRVLLAVLLVLLVGTAASLPRVAVRAQGVDPCSGTNVNPIACENSKPGNPASEWDISGSGSPNIQGFATDISVNVGGVVHFKIDTTATSYQIDIYRIGYYGGNGARKMATLGPFAGVSQPNCLTDASTGLIDCGNWSESATWTVPSTAISGVYIAKLTATAGVTGSSHIIFVVRDDSSTADILFQTSDTTWQAYNQYGGNSLYVGGPGTNPGRAYKVSYNRPFTTRGTGAQDFFFNAEYPMVRWLEANGYRVSYAAGIDSDRSGSRILQHKVFMSVGHDEYWSGQQRANVEAARTAGVNLMFLSGNEVFWKTRWEPSIDGTSTDYRTLVCYKETHANAKIDPMDPPTWTGTWRDPRFSPPADGGRPENALTGTIFTVNDGATSSIKVPSTYKSLRIWRNTSIATMPDGQTATFPDGTLGYEWDEALDNGAQPAGLVKLSSTTLNVASKLLDYGSTYGSGTATHSLTMYNDPSGALVFGAGTVQWSWGLDNHHDRGSNAPDIRMQQATVNMLGDMNAQPTTLQPGLVAATGSNDATAPTTTITSPTAGSTVAAGTLVTVVGTATDVGGVVTNVQVSVDGGLTWNDATGTTSWSYGWTPAGSGAATVRARATDDSGNVENPGASVSVTVNPGGAGAGLIASYNFDAGSGTTLADMSGNHNDGTIANATWTTSGRNGSALSFNGSNAWVTVPDTAALHLTNGMTLEAWVRPTTLSSWRSVLMKETSNGLSYSLYAHDGSRPAAYINTGGSDIGQAGTSGLAANTWTHLATTYDGSTLRLYVNGTQVASRSASGNLRSSTSPFRIGGDAPWGEYFAGLIDDVRVYNRAISAAEVANDMNTPVAPPETIPPTVTGVSPANGAVGISVTASISATFSEPLLSTSIDGTTFDLRTPANQIVPATVTYNAGTATATLTPSAPLAYNTLYTATVHGGTTDPRVKDLAGNALAANYVWSFTTAGAPAGCPCSIWGDAISPVLTDSNDPSGTELGVKFQSDKSGYITGIRFYKVPANTGTHVGNLWSADGTTQLGSVTFTGETSSGWQQANFTTPIPITANTTYVASYFAPAGHYSADPSYFTTGVDKSPLHALADATSSNGVYRYGTLSGFPDQTFNATNYWVDVVFTDVLNGDTTPPTVTAIAPANGTVNVATSSTVVVTFSEAMDPASITTSSIELRTASNSVIPATVTYDAVARAATLQPTSALPVSTTYTVTVHGGPNDPHVKDLAGNPLVQNATASFTTVTPGVNEGPGGPILVVASAANPFSRYYAEILRNEGMNEYLVTDLENVTSALLDSYDVVVLGDMPLSGAQVTMFGTYVNGGGKLIAMRPDKQLASLLGLTTTTTTLTDKYLLIANTGAGTGLVHQTIQFHGTADRYTLNGATSLATLYSSATASTSNPAVTLRSVGSNGGQAAAFTFDLARSVVYTRQGNPAWNGQERDGQSPVRSDDLFYGARTGDVQPDWVDRSKIAIPQADEQQRLLANLILQMNSTKKPLPRFWYLPRMLKAAVVMTGDDHGNNGTEGRFNGFLANSVPGCNVDNWECLRMTSYIYPSTPLSPSTAASFVSQGFEVGVHVTTNCGDYTPTSLESDYSSQLADFASKYTSVPAPRTNRTHCIPWSDYASQPQIELNHGIRFDTNYYYWPPDWVADTPGLFTGSGLPMRFTKIDGTVIDVYQATTQITDESGQTIPTHIATLLDNALGTAAYYVVVTANMHTDTAQHDGSDAIVAAAQARGVPVVSAVQMLTWLDGRNNSSFGSLTWAGNTLTFSLTQASGANGLRAMLPASFNGQPLTSLTRNGSAVTVTTQTLKGVSYAIFDGLSGSYSATYGSAPDTTITSAPATTTTSTSASFSFTSTPSGATFQCSLDGAAFATCTSPRSYTGLSVAAHTFQVRAVNGNGTDPTPASFSWTIGTVPNTTITSNPGSTTTNTGASFSFTSTPTGATFECALDGAPFAACVSPTSYTGLATGSHTFQVRAVNAFGTDPSPASWTWTISGPVPPDTTITGNPGTTTTSTSASFTFTSTPSGATFECSLDASAFTACTSPVNFSGLTLASHTFQVRAIDANGTDPSPASWTWTITAPVPPDTTITANPGSTTTATNASFSFTSTPTGATFECSLDAAAFAACTSPASYTGLATGAHTFQVRAVNGVGPDPTPASWTWTINPATQGLVVALGFEEGSGTTTADASGSNNNGTLSNATWSSAGKFGKALSFNGSNAWVTVADAASLDLTNAMTMEAWVNPTSLSSWRAVILKEASSGLAYALYASDGSRPNTYLRMSGQGTDFGLTGTSALPLNTWTHIAATYDGATVRFYVNGVQVSSAAKTGNIQASTNPLRIGGDAPWGEYFSGLIDEVRVYSRVLTAAEIQADMNTAIKP